MNLYISKDYSSDYAIMLDDDTSFMDDQVADMLGLTHEQYKKILLKHNGKFFIHRDNTIDEDYIEFENREDAERAIEELIPFLIMANLLGE